MLRLGDLVALQRGPDRLDLSFQEVVVPAKVMHQRYPDAKALIDIGGESNLSPYVVTSIECQKENCTRMRRRRFHWRPPG
jgi:hypothetical protein